MQMEKAQLKSTVEMKDGKIDRMHTIEVKKIIWCNYGAPETTVVTEKKGVEWGVKLHW